VKLALDHHYSPAIAYRLRELGFDAIAIHERGWHTDTDAVLLHRCAEDARALMTNNVADLLPLAKQWQSEAREHSGLILTSDRSMPRTQATVGAYVAALSAVLRAYSAPHGLSGVVLWLTPPG
jgi:hypothetical protein